MLVSFAAGYFLSHTECGLKTSRVQRYLGIICDSDAATFRVPEDKLRKLHALIQAALDETIAGKCIRISVAIRPASLWTQLMFAAPWACDLPRKQA